MNVPKKEVVKIRIEKTIKIFLVLTLLLIFYAALALAVNELVVDAATGNVGIGTSSPNYSLDVQGDGVLVGNTRIWYADDRLKISRPGYPTIESIGIGGGNDNLYIGGTLGKIHHSGSAMVVKTTSTNDQLFLSSSASTITLDALGRIGLNSYVPDYKLETTGTSGEGYFGVTNAVNGDIFEIDSSGNVGIGNSTPGYKLHVEGDIGIGGNITSLESVGGASNPAFIFDTLGNSTLWGNLQILYSFRENGVEFLTIDGIGNVIPPQGNFVTNSVAPQSGSSVYIGHGMRRRSISSGFDFPWGESISSATEPGVDFFPIGGTHNTSGILLRVSKNSTRTDVAFQIDGDGNVGIGTDSPTAKLDVNGATYIRTGGLRVSGGFSQYTTENTIIANDAGASYGIDFLTNSSQRMRITSDGNVGIGTTTPSAKLDVNGNISTTELCLTGDTCRSTWPTEGGGGGTGIWNRSETNVFLNNSGDNVGIGTSSPQEHLHVYGAGNQRIEVEGTGAAADAAIKLTGNAGKFAIFAQGTTDRLGIWDYTVGTEVFTLKAGKLGIGTDSPERTLSIQTLDYTNADQGILFMNTGADVADAIVQPWEFGAGVGLAIGANAYVDTSGNFARFDTAEESSAILVDPRGEIYFLTSGTGANPTTKMTILDSGLVGIGTSGPTAPLEISETGNTPIIRIGRSDLDVNENKWDFRIENASNKGELRIRAITDAGGTETHVMSLERGGDVIFNGNIGIGTVSPGRELEVKSSGLTGIAINEGSTIWYLDNRGNNDALGDDFWISDGGGVPEFMIDQSTGNVGIGTSSPATLLEVEGGTARAQITSTTNAANVGLIFQAKSADTTTEDGGIYYVANDTNANSHLSLSGDNSNYHLSVTQAGKVGIGTVAPTTFFELNSPTNPVQMKIVNTKVSTAGNIIDIIAQSKNDAEELTVLYIMRGSMNNRTDGSEETTIDFQTLTGGARTDRLTIKGNKVGIGTGEPSHELNVIGDANVTGTLYADVTGNITGNAATATTAGGAPPTGTAGGGLGGTYPNPTVDDNWINDIAEWQASCTGCVNSGDLDTDYISEAEMNTLAEWDTQIQLTGTQGATNFLRGDGAWTTGYLDADGSDAVNDAVYNEATIQSVCTLCIGDAQIVQNSIDASEIAADAVSNSELDGGFGWTLDTDLNIDANTLVVSYDNNRVGIGTNSPAAALDVNGRVLTGSATDGVYLTYNTGIGTVLGYDGSGYNDLDLRATVTAGTGLYLPSTGNVGIGTTGPLSKLSVGGVGVANTGVYGSGTTYGVYGSGGTDGVHGIGGTNGVYGSGTSNGVSGSSVSKGVYGSGTSATFGKGVYGSGGHTGVYGSGLSFAGYMSGNFYVTGTCSGGSTCNEDIAEKWVSEKALKHIHCGEDRFNYTNETILDDMKDNFQYTCILDQNFELEFEQGDVVCFDRAIGSVTVIKYCEKSYDKTALSTLSYNATMTIGAAYYPYPVSLAGNIPVKVICDNPIEVGDPLVTSNKPGYAMKLDISDVTTFKEFQERNNAIFAKALEPCESGKKLIRAWI